MYFTTVLAELHQASGFLRPEPLVHAGAAVLAHLWSPSPPEGITEGGSVVVDAGIASGLAIAAALLARAARPIVEMVQGGRRPKLRFRDWVPAPFD